MRPGKRKLSDRVGVILAGGTLLFFLSAAATIVVPSLDPALGETTESSRTFDTKEAVKGMRLFRSEGCWYCHTQQVRRTMTDLPLGEQLAPGDYANQTPAMLGAERLGPDLTHVGNRYSGRADELRSLLRDPRADRAPSTMPAYGYLSDAQMDDLVEYLLSLR